MTSYNVLASSAYIPFTWCYSPGECLVGLVNAVVHYDAGVAQIS